MRSVEQTDAWRRVAKELWRHPLRLDYLELHKAPGFADRHVDLNAGLALLCGVNASGKTRLLRSIASGLWDPSSGAAGHTRLGMVGTPQHVHYVDIFHLSQGQLRSIHTDRDLASRVEQAGESRLRPKELRMLRWLVGRDYQDAGFAELDATSDQVEDIDPYDDDSFYERFLDNPAVAEPQDDDRLAQAAPMEFRPDVMPYFFLTYNGRRYGSESLSRGELAAMNLLWALKSIEQESIVLFDEPDLFLSAESSARALTVIAEYAHINRSPTIVATHSVYGLAKAPGTYRVLLNAVNGDTALEVGTDVQMWRSLRVAAPTNLILAVEDEAGRQWTNLFASRIELSENWAYEVWKFGDASKVRAAAAMPDAADSTFRMVGVLDGDERKRPAKNLVNLVFLPSSLTPEEFLLDQLRHSAELPDLLQRPRERILSALGLFEGDDPHDRIPAIAEDLGFTVAQLRGDIWHWWFSTPDGQTALAEWRRFFAELQAPGRRKPVNG